MHPAPASCACWKPAASRRPCADLCDLAGPFQYKAVSVGLGLGATAEMFSGSTGISGSLVSFGRGLGVTLTAGTSWDLGLQVRSGKCSWPWGGRGDQGA
jgi:hypothetical protein